MSVAAKITYLNFRIFPLVLVNAFEQMALENQMKVLVLPDQISKLIKTFAPSHFSLPHISQKLDWHSN